MTLNDFMAKVLGWIEKSEAAQTPNKDQAGKVAELEGKLAEANKTIEARDATIKDLTAKLEAAQNEVNAKGTEAKNLQAQLEAEKKRVDETLAAQGVNPKTIPAGKADETPASDSGILGKFEAITDPVKRQEFFNANKAAIYAARRNLK